jgi:hypothetical protein
MVRGRRIASVAVVVNEFMKGAADHFEWFVFQDVAVAELNQPAAMEVLSQDAAGQWSDNSRRQRPGDGGLFGHAGDPPFRGFSGYIPFLHDRTFCNASYAEMIFSLQSTRRAALRRLEVDGESRNPLRSRGSVVRPPRPTG